MLGLDTWRQLPCQVRVHGLHTRCHLTGEAPEPGTADPG
jgi:hypothetical protein